jgi:hypothetical protein
MQADAILQDLGAIVKLGALATQALVSCFKFARERYWDAENSTMSCIQNGICEYIIDAILSGHGPHTTLTCRA